MYASKSLASGGCGAVPGSVASSILHQVRVVAQCKITYLRDQRRRRPKANRRSGGKAHHNHGRRGGIVPQALPLVGVNRPPRRWMRSEERRVGKEGRAWGVRCRGKKK